MAKKKKNEELNTAPEQPEEEVNASVEDGEIEEGASEKGKEKDKMVTVPLADYAAQLEEIDDLTLKVDEFSDGWQRERAEFANYRKRMGRDLDTQKINFRVDVINKYLTVKDDLELALKNLPESLQGESWINGIELINQKLTSLLSSEGIELVPVEGVEFDPTIHEAITNEESETVKSGFIIEAVQQGYKIGDRVIRPARVRVAK